MDTTEEIAARLQAMTDPESETRANHPSNPPEWLQQLYGWAPSAGRVQVNERSALSVSGVFACVRNLAEDVAKLPLITYRNLEPMGKQRLPHHPVYRVLHDRANPEMSAFEARQALTASAALWGGGIAEIEKNIAGDIAAIWPIEPWRWQIDRDKSGKLVYIVDGKDAYFSDRILHIKGFSINGIVGEMVACVGGDSMGIAIAAQKFSSAFFTNGLNPGGVIEYPAKLTETALKNMRESWAAQHGGPERANKPLILEQGTKYTATSVDPEKAQMLESRQFQVEDVARWFRMPPHKIGHLLRATGWSTLEATNSDYIIDTLLPWFVKWEQEGKYKLIADFEPDVFIEHLVDGMLRGDADKRSTALQIQFQNGALTLDEWRAIENRNPLPDGMGGHHFVPMNMTTVAKAIADDPEEEAEEPEEQPQDLARFQPLIDDVAARLRRRETEVLKRAAKKPETYADFRSEFFKEHEEYVRNAIRPVIVAVTGTDQAAGRIAEDYVDAVQVEYEQRNDATDGTLSKLIHEVCK